MASIAGLSRTAAEHLLRDLDLDELYMRQIATLDLRGHREYPYTVFLFAGKITVGISPGTTSCDDARSRRISGPSNRPREGKRLFPGRPTEEYTE